MAESRPSQIVLWGLRLLAHGVDRAAAAPAALDRAWVRVLGLTGRYDLGIHDDAVKKAVRKTSKRLEAAASDAGIDRSTLVFENVATLGAEMAMGVLEQDILAFALLSHTHDLLVSAFRQLGAETGARALELLPAVLGVPREAVKRALAKDAALVSTGLVRMAECTWYEHHEPIQVPWRVSEILRREHEDKKDMITCFFRRSRQASLTRADYEHARADVSIVSKLIEATNHRRARGVNVLVYGAPGTGKTELARMIAAEVKADLFEVNVDDEEGDAIQRHGRLAAYTLAQRLLAGGTAKLVLFDEIEDVFPRTNPKAERESGEDKGWTNRLLEENAVPTIWIGNSVDHIDPAFLRRFDYALELKTPPARVRAKIIERYAAAASLSVSPEVAARLADDERLTPAHVERAVRVAELAGSSNQGEVEATLTRVLDRSLALAGRANQPARRSHRMAFDRALLCASTDLDRVVEGIRGAVSASICLHGPPGTGKTAFAYHLAEAIGAPLHARRASDLVSPFVGETEQNLAAMFQRAREEHAMVFLDEADSFFRSRARAFQSWEVTQVNELLVQMETFDGVFVCATNMFDQLDEASLRRFALKIGFAPPAPEQRWRLFEILLADLRVALDPADQPELRMRLDRLDTLTPGDFSAVLRRAALIGEQSATMLSSALAEEVATRASSKRAIGFRG